MDKNTSISLHLAKVMGLQNIQTAPEQYQVGERVTHELTDIRREIFNPFTNRAQWADVLLFAWRKLIKFNSADKDFITYELSQREWRQIPHSNTDESRMAATLEAIALATGWAG